MKHIKQYEQHSEYEIGDYIKIKIEKYYRLNPYQIVQIADEYGNEYTIEILNQNTNKLMYSSIKKYSEIIDRKATPEEIEEFKIRLYTNKYNL